MRLRPVWIFSALILLSMGALAAWIALTVPNDIRAEAILRKARNDLRDGRRDDSKEKLRTLVRSYPRTDAAATAAETLFQMSEQEQAKLARSLQNAQRDQAQLASRLAAVEQKVAAPPPPAPKPASIKPAKKVPAKKATKKKTHRRHRRR